MSVISHEDKKCADNLKFTLDYDFVSEFGIYSILLRYNFAL